MEALPSLLLPISMLCFLSFIPSPLLLPSITSFQNLGWCLYFAFQLSSSVEAWFDCPASRPVLPLDTLSWITFHSMLCYPRENHSTPLANARPSNFTLDPGFWALFIWMKIWLRGNNKHSHEDYLYSNEGSSPHVKSTEPVLSPLPLSSLLIPKAIVKSLLHVAFTNFPKDYWEPS